MVNKVQIHKEIREFMMISSKLIKSNNELMIKMVDYARELKIISMESKIIEIDLDFAEKLKIKVERIFLKL